MSLEIRRSSIHAHGCYTTESLGKGTFIVEYTGRRLTVAQADQLYENSEKTYLFGLTDGKYVIDGDGIAAFINHSCAPNCEVDEAGGRVFIIASRDIQAGEELLYDYNLYDGELDDLSPCSCRAGDCRGSMYSEDEIARRRKAAERRERGASTRNGHPRNTKRKRRA